MPSARIRKAILPAGGLGTRLRPLTQVMPKEMLPVGGKVVLQYVLEECDAAGLDSLLVVIHRDKTALIGAAEATPGLMDPATDIPRRLVHFACQTEQGGLAHAVMHGESFVGEEHFAVALADTIIEGGVASLLGRMIAAHLEHGAAATVAAQEVPLDRVSRYGILEPEGDAGDVFRVRRIVEKPQPENAPSRLAITARYVFSPEIFAACRHAPRNERGEFELTNAMTYLAEQGRPIVAVRLEPRQERLDIGHPASYFQAFQRLADSAGK